MKRILAIVFSVTTFVLIILGSSYIGLFNSKKIFVVVPGECTAPDFDVIFGEQKLVSQTPDSLKNYIFNFNSMWVINKDDFFKIREGEYEDYYTLTFDFIGKKRESDTADWNPLLKSTNWKRIDSFLLLSYLIVTFITFVLSLKYIRQSIKKLE